MAWPTGPYAPRDVLNAPSIKAAIDRRSRARGDPPEVTAWLSNHFYRHVVGNLILPEPDVQQIESRDEARACLSTSSLPDWVLARLVPNSSRPALWWVDPQSPVLLALEGRLVEFLSSRRGTSLEGKLMRVNGPQAIALWATEHAAFEAQQSAGLRHSRPDALRLAWTGALGSFFEFIHDGPALRSEMAYESQSMRHCLGQFASRQTLSGGYGEHYATACAEARMRLFTYRTGAQQPHITISARVEPDGRLAIDQIKGKQNRPPIARYQDDVLGFLRSLPTACHTPPDAVAMGMVRLEDGWRRINEIRDPAQQVRLVHRDPALVRDLPEPCALAQWIVASQRPDLLDGLALTPGAARTLRRSPGTAS